MFCPRQSSGLAVAGLAILQLTLAAQAQERMQLGAPVGAATEFQAQVGDRVFFGEGSTELGSRARAALEAQAAWLKRHGSLPVTVEGHADDMGSINHNLDVSWRRAEAVRRRLIESGVAADRIRIVGFGRERRIAECAMPGCAVQNRRVVTVIGGPTAASVTPDRADRDSNDTAARRAPRRLF
jgi:outer membrane protein OmpA-like peptidoglycan-associated protein